jgi:hypothetical protein
MVRIASPASARQIRWRHERRHRILPPLHKVLRRPIVSIGEYDNQDEPRLLDG